MVSILESSAPAARGRLARVSVRRTAGMLSSKPVSTEAGVDLVSWVARDAPPAGPPAGTLAESAVQLVSTVAHELSTPLTSLSLMVEMLLNEFDTMARERARDMLGRIQQNVFWLDGLVENLRATSALDVGTIRPRLVPMPLDDCVATALALVQPILDRGRQRVERHGLGRRAMVLGDTRLIERVLVNLLCNAARYTPPGGLISLDVRSSTLWMEVRVTDRGPGIVADDQARIFERYVRGESVPFDRRAGLGLGLAVVKGIVQVHGGAVGVDSRPGEGASFWFTLPRARASGSGGAEPPQWSSPEGADPTPVGRHRLAVAASSRLSGKGHSE